MQLHHLLRLIHPHISLHDIADVSIAGVCEDSRLVRPGYLFVARPGTKTDGSKFVTDAIARGAAAILAAEPLPYSQIPCVTAAHPGRAISIAAHALAGDPARNLKCIGITGTNGKTTTAYLMRSLLARIGMRCGLIGTVEVDDGVKRREAQMTTPAPCDIADLFTAMRANSCGACVMETSSHSLHQGRVAGIRFAGAAFTNLTRDHLDYHGTMANYGAAKAMLFESLDQAAVAVVNHDDEWTRRMVLDCGARVVSFGFGPGANYLAKNARLDGDGSRFTLQAPAGTIDITMQMMGRHNILNAMTAAALCIECFGMSLKDVAEGLRREAGAPGRLQAVRCGQPFTVLIDYAHTDDALDNVLSALAPLKGGKLRVLFGCGGDRDAGKRPRMARVAEKWADAIYVTSDNPRTERPESIIDQIADGFSDIGRSKTVFEMDRRRAIQRVLADAEPNDIVLLAGKGHENYQIIGQEKKHFDDAEEAVNALRQTAA